MASGRYALAPTITSYHLIADRNIVVQSLKGAIFTWLLDYPTVFPVFKLRNGGMFPVSAED
jgi:hypothetical protein